MKRLLILGILAQFSFGIANAQYEKAVRLSSDTTRTSLIREVSKGLNAELVSSMAGRDKSNWFFDAAIGGGFYSAELNRYSGSFLSRMRCSAQVSAGKWIYPAWAVRLALGYSKFVGDYYLFSKWNMYDEGNHSTAPADALKAVYVDESGVQWFTRRFSVADAQFDVMYDVNRFFTKRQTPFDIIAYAGLGYSYAFKSQGVNWNSSLAFKFGLDVNINITKAFYVKAGIEGSIVDESLDGSIGGYSGKTNRTVEGYGQALVGVGVRWGGKQRTKTYTMPYSVDVSKDYKTKQEVVLEDFKAPFVVRFYIDQYNVEPDQELNIAKVCTYLQQHPDARLLMTGHCDPETGNPEYNQKLSERRCNSVLKYIEDNYNIDSSRIDVQPMGDTQSNFKDDYRWNRCVILTIIDK